MEKAKKGPPFSAIPLRALADRQLSELHLRTLAIISYHDRMSLVKGVGQGCWASSTTMADELGGYHITNVSTAITQLEKWGYIQIEKRPGDRRLRVYRVIFEAADDLPHGQTNDAPNCEDHLPTGKPSQKVVCPPSAPNPQKTTESYSQEISLSDERDFAEARKRNSVETAPRAFSAPRVDDYEFEDIHPSPSEKNGAEAPAIRRSLTAEIAHRSKHFTKLSADAQLSHFERAFEAIGRNAGVLDHEERCAWEGWLLEVSHSCTDGGHVGYRADRLLDEFEASHAIPSPHELRKWMKAAVDTLGYGGQGKLAEDADIPAPTLSQFRNGKNLPEKYHAPLQQACERALPFHEWREAMP